MARKGCIIDGKYGASEYGKERVHNREPEHSQATS